MNNKYILILTFIIAFLFVSCQKDNMVFSLGEEINIAFNKNVKVEDSDKSLEIKFTKLVEESRCPPNAYCFWIGRVIVNLEFNGSETSTLGILSTNDSISSEVVFDKYKIQLLGVDYGKDGNYGMEKKYTARIKVEKN